MAQADAGERETKYDFARTVQKIIKPIDPQAPEQAEIAVDKAEELYREIHVENTLVNEKGEEVGLRPGAPVEVTIEANEKDTVKKDIVKKEKSAGT
jgi:hypothetical protein